MMLKMGAGKCCKSEGVLPDPNLLPDPDVLNLEPRVYGGSGDDKSMGMKNRQPNTLIFDMDGCLYSNPEFMTYVHNQIFHFMISQTQGKFNAITNLEEARAVWKPIFEKYNLTKRGLQAEGYVFNSDEYDDFIRKDMASFIVSNDKLKTLIDSLPQKTKVIMTNCPERHALECLKLIGIDKCFSKIYGTSFFDGKCKPEVEVFDLVLKDLGLESLEERKNICYFEDSYMNMIAGKRLGFKTVFVKCETLAAEGRKEDELSEFDCLCDIVVNESDLRRGAGWLWDDGE